MRNGDPIRTWQAAAGSLVLLRGPGLAGDPDGRLMHLVGGPTGTPRTSIGGRMDNGVAESAQPGDRTCLTGWLSRSRPLTGIPKLWWQGQRPPTLITAGLLCRVLQLAGSVLV